LHDITILLIINKNAGAQLNIALLSDSVVDLSPSFFVVVSIVDFSVKLVILVIKDVLSVESLVTVPSSVAKIILLISNNADYIELLIININKYLF